MARKMKDSGVEWIGEIPQEWEVIKTKYVVDITNGSEPKTDDGDIPVYGSGAKSFRKCKEYKDGPAVLLGRKGTIEIPQWIEGRYWNVDTAFDAKSKENIELKLYYYMAQCFDYNQYKTKTALPSMNQSNYYNIKLPYTNLKEQKSIVDYLGSIDIKINALIDQLSCAVDDYKKYKNSIIIKVVTKGLKENIQMKPTDSEWIGDIPEHWDYVRIGTLFQTVDERNDDPDAQLLSLYTALGVKPRSELEERGNKAVTVQNYKIVHKNDIIVNKLLAWMGAIGYSDYEGVTSPDYDVYRAKEGANVVRSFYNNYFRYTCFNGDCFKYGHGIMLMRWRTYPEEFLRIKVPNPPYDEQVEIAEYLDKKIPEIDKLISEKEELIKELENYKKSLIYEYVTGKKEVPVENVR